MSNATEASIVTTFVSRILQHDLVPDLYTDNYTSSSTANFGSTPAFTVTVPTSNNIISASLPDPVSVFLAAVAVTLSALAIVCNSLLVAAIIRSRELQTPTNLFLGSLALGETLFAVFGMPVAAACVLAGGWPFSRGACGGTAALQSIGRSASTLSLMAVCLDRCLAVSRPLKYSHILTLHTGSFLLLALWLLAITLALLPINRVWGRYAYDDAHFLCIHMADGGLENLGMEIICSFLPAVVIVASMLQIIRDVRSHHRIFSVVPIPMAGPAIAAAAELGGPGGGRGRLGGGEHLPGLVLPVGIRSFNRNTMRAMRSLFIVTLGYALFCLPSDFENGHVNWTSLRLSQRPRLHVTAIVWLSFLCGLLNPLIIIALNRKFRREVGL
ncbi:hypothetical protein EGW08_018346, partial [Elysia chlorotica]